MSRLCILAAAIQLVSAYTDRGILKLDNTYARQHVSFCSPAT